MKKAIVKPPVVITEQKKDTKSKSAQKPKAGSLQVTLVRGLSGCSKTQIAVAHSLGLKYMGDCKVQPDNAATKGKIDKISFLLPVTKALVAASQ